MTTPQPTTAPQKSKTKTYLTFAVLLALCCCGPLILVTIYRAGQTAGIFPTDTPTPLAQPTAQPTAQPLDQPTLQPLKAESTTPPTIAAPTETPAPLSMTLEEFYAKYEGLTDVQKENFRNLYVGRYVAWEGTVNNVSSDGNIYISIPGTYTDTVHLENVPKELAMRISKGETLHFTGHISSIIDFIGTAIFIDDPIISQ